MLPQRKPLKSAFYIYQRKNKYIQKELSFCHKLIPLIFQTINSDRDISDGSNHLRFKYNRFTTLDYQHIGNRKFLIRNETIFFITLEHEKYTKF